MKTTNRKYITRSEVLRSPSVHNFTKEILIRAESLDPLDAVKDVELALIVLCNELEGGAK